MPSSTDLASPHHEPYLSSLRLALHSDTLLRTMPRAAFLRTARLRHAIHTANLSTHRLATPNLTLPDLEPCRARPNPRQPNNTSLIQALNHALPGTTLAHLTWQGHALNLVCRTGHYRSL